MFYDISPLSLLGSETANFADFFCVDKQITA
jgi:hypothetical protein